MPKDDLSGKNLDHANLSDIDLSAADLSDASLRSAKLKRTNLQDADLSGSNLHGAQLDHADLAGADLSSADLTEASLTGVDLGQASDTTGITLTGATGLPQGEARRRDGDTPAQVPQSGRWIVPNLQRLLTELGRPGWVTDRPEMAFLLPIQAACADAGSPWTFQEVLPSADAYIVTVSWHHPGGNLYDLRADVFTLLGTIAESVTFVHQTQTPTAVEYRIATGTLAEDGPFASHGHIILLRVRGPDVTRLLRPYPHDIPGG
jgi:hypothetical protein